MRCPIIAVTGTNGKTTTVSMLTQTLKENGLNAFACGNIGSPMIDFSYQDNGVAVAEISSFQMETLSSIRPHIAVFLNITEDHLNRHYNMENYIFLKAKLLKNMTETEFAVFNYDDETVKVFAEKTKARVYWFSVKERVNGAYLEDGFLTFNGEKILSSKELALGGIHNVQNALAVIVACKIFGVENAVIKKALIEFKGIKHRLEKIAEIDGVEYIDDSKGTNIDATLQAIKTVNKDTVLLLGGKNKGYEYKKLFGEIKNSKVRQAILYGENRYALLKGAREENFENITLCQDFYTAVSIARLLVKSGETVLLSPASASFDEFAGYEERGDKFVEIVRGFKGETNAQADEIEE
jgi:UDP-N-acetylmuramoylalanine--D-glutamate ligase